ncbi:four-carbon acid sugar kinase family protein [Tessaracoccus coleopterorum]|uniref:four-carbon acid sugar kinase family protein n=1 Tax=Tessaracoccus coleopterorum TaxID=2714950 RepID=UPI001E64718B|nr:four-carbon acid sugar kinase family protein [Tessaracoccus coleopterorum]
MTNSRSLPEAEAANRNREVVEASLQAADELGCEVDFVSRSDSTLRGHYPLEPDAITGVLTTRGEAIDGVILVPAFGEAGRITVDGIHYAGNDRDGYAPVGDSEFARDATFGYASSDLRDWVAEKSGGRIPRNEVGLIRLDDLRGDRDAVVAQLLGGAEVIAVDIVEETDLRALALSLAEAETKGSGSSSESARRSSAP